MTAQVGRTVPAYTKLLMGAAGGSMLDMKIDELGDLGLDYEEVEMKAWSDAVAGVLMGKPDFSLTFGGPIDNTASTGPSTLLRSWLGANTCLSFDVQVGVRHAWEANEQQFGVTGVSASNSGVCVTSYKESGGKYSATIRMLSGSAAAPAWGTAAEAVPS
jgi:hypothetical protein